MKFYGWLGVKGSVAYLVLLTVVVFSACGKKKPEDTLGEVVVYTSVDDVFARPVAEQFQKETGIEVKLVTDTEETKSTGLLNRLIAEKARPRADVFWSGDPVRAAVLKSKNVSAAYHSPAAEGMPTKLNDPDGHWQALSARARVILYHKNLVKPDEVPKSLDDFLLPRWKGKACIANPLFGTTSMHAAALFEVWGEKKAKAFFEGLMKNDVAMLSSNGEVKRRVAAGDFAFGLTDTDDASVALKEGKSVGMVYPDGEAPDGMGTLIIPNAAVLIAHAPHPDNAKRFVDYLLSAQVEEALAASEAAQMPLRPGVPVPPGVVHLDEIRSMTVDYEKLSVWLEKLSHGYLKEWADRNAR
jgi:iron(III) transport system substrate-binding protein